MSAGASSSLRWFASKTRPSYAAKRIYDEGFQASNAPKCRVALCPQVAKKPKAENILKTKDQERAFCSSKAENILKKKPLIKGRGNSKKA
jgi:hypothetical protein